MNIFVAFFLLLRILAESTPPANTSIPLLGMCSVHISLDIPPPLLFATPIYPPKTDRIRNLRAVCTLAGLYFCMNMVLITASSFVSVTVININNRADKRNRLPAVVKKVKKHS